MISARKAPGFTLLEVLIALAVFALCASVLIRHNAQATDHEYQLERRVRAQWLAADRLNAARLNSQWPAIGVTTDSEVINGQTWETSQEIAETVNSDLVRVVITVASAEKPGYPLARLTGFLGRH